MPFYQYVEDMAKEWDSFVLENAVNGNFLQTRRFLSYHPEGRFEDASLAYRDQKGNLRAVIPAAVVEDPDGDKAFVSHPGSTYGGLVLDAKTCSAKRLRTLVSELEEYLETEDYARADLRIPPGFMWTRAEAPLVEYILGLHGWDQCSELTTYIDFESYGDNTLKNFSQGKRTNVNNCIKRGLETRKLDPDSSDLNRLYEILCKNLERHGAKPVHTIEELRLLAGDLLADDSELLGVYDGEDLIAGGWVFLFVNQRVSHAQYLCADDAYAKLSPMTFLYYSVIERSREKGYRALSWGISTEDRGRVLNEGLTESKESFGSLHGVHRRFGKRFCR